MQDHPENPAGQDPVVALARKLLSAREAFSEADIGGDTDATDALMERCHDLEDRIAATQATSIRGVLVQAVLLRVPFETGDFSEYGQRLLENAIGALERLAGVEHSALVGRHYPQPRPRNDNVIHVPFGGGPQ